MQLADVKRKIDDFNGAELDYKSALSKEDINEQDKFTSHRGLGLIAKKRNKYDLALTHYNAARSLKEINPTKQYELGVLYIDSLTLPKKKFFERKFQISNF